MTTKPSALAIEQWPQEVGFVPFVGCDYELGIAGKRVLVLGESHYRKEGVDNSDAVTRAFTRETFSDRVLPAREPRSGRFYPPMDRLLTGDASPTPQAAADAWKRIAFCNLVQQFAGDKAGDRPTGRQFREGTRVLVDHTLPLLRPDLMLVLGRRTWVELRYGCEPVDAPPYTTERVRAKHERTRNVWRIRHAGGETLMTWVYHPSRGIDHWTDMHGALQHLLQLAPS